ncbi:uncharacterized protein LOC115750812 isoform X1 [Rhodamnia argentea]|uniref:Uncharacterized protein LOC115750812 isoform X1 n=2 Tax=Rhodamnia argentea TaxID=178133 RepID=A0A8B8QDH9_9MYRT|nr:uncharacterized protein LOC115750812 isoform X1 [Rhodamnia argentea]
MEDCKKSPPDSLSCTDENHTIVLKLSKRDPLFHKKKKLLQSKGYDVEMHIQLKSASHSKWARTTAESILQVSRIMHLDEAELYFREDGSCSPTGYYTQKNELEALNSMLCYVNSSFLDDTCSHKDVLRDLQEAIIQLICDFGDKNITETTVINSQNCDKENFLVQWGEKSGVKNRLQIAYIEGFGRGAIAVTDLKVGDIALEIPVSAVISEDAMKKSDMFPTLEKVDDGISTETMLLLWSMKERYNSSSTFKNYFDTLPEEFNTGLSFGVDAIVALDGTLLLEELIQAKEHLRNQYDELFPALCEDHPDIFPPELYTWEQFLWACELWYSNSMKIQFADGALKTCLIPIAGFLNHSLYPHITQYGKVDSATNSLKFSMSRPCHAGEQCYLSYGNFSSSHLITFYGFMPQMENPYDIIQLDIDGSQDVCSGELDASSGTTHMVRGTWFSDNHSIFHYGLPAPLLNHLRSARELFLDAVSPLPEKLNIEIEILEDLCSTFSGMMENLGEVDSESRENMDWDVKLAAEYKNLQRRIISSILSSCYAGRKLVEDELCKSMAKDSGSPS